MRTPDYLLYGLICILFGAITYFYIAGIQLTLYEYLQVMVSVAVLYATILMTITSAKQAKASEKQAEASILQVEAAKESLKASVRPSLSFRIRPADDFWSKRNVYDVSTWMPGVGIYIDNVGAGHAFNIQFICHVFGDKEEHKYPVTFPRLLAGDRYTVPSKAFKEIEIKPHHKKIVIEDLEFDDINIPPNKYRFNEVDILEIYPELFKESKIPPPPQ